MLTPTGSGPVQALTMNLLVAKFEEDSTNLPFYFSSVQYAWRPLPKVGET